MKGLSLARILPKSKAHEIQKTEPIYAKLGPQDLVITSSEKNSFLDILFLTSVRNIAFWTKLERIAEPD